MRNVISFLLLINALLLNGQALENVTGINVGDTIPSLNGIAIDSSSFDFQKNLENGPLIVVFYRGQWCPYCNRHLSHMQDSIHLIEDKGAQVIAVSPERLKYLSKSAEKSGAKFTLIYDEGYKIADAFNVLFQPSEQRAQMYNRYGADLKNAHSDDTQRLPVPATFVISKEGVVLWKHFEGDYKRRSSIKEILKYL